MKRKISAEKVVKIKKKKTDPLDKKVLTAEEREHRKNSLYRAPTSEELGELRENEDLYKNNLFRMQIQYLLEEVCLQEKKLKNINAALHSLNTFLKDVPAQNESFDISSENVLPEGGTLPLPELFERSRIKGSFQFHPPKEIRVIGSFLLKTTIKSNQCVDVAVEIPEECLHSRDFLNFRYLYKRAIYLSWLASCLKDWEHTEDLQYACACDAYKPVLKIKLKGKLGKRWSITLHTSIPQNVFKLQRYAPLRNNVRSSWYNEQEGDIVEDIESPTPLYNTSVLCDMLYERHLHDLYNAQKECTAMKDAVCLFKVWLKQRSFKGCSAFNGFFSSMLIVYLLSIRKISPQMSSYQIFRLMLHFIVSSDWTKTGISLCKEKLSEAKVEDFHSLFDVVFIDSSGYLNLCAGVDASTYEMLKWQAELSLAQLDGGSSIRAFECLFIKSQSFFQYTDHSFKLTNLECLEKYFSQSDTSNTNVMDVGGDWTRLILKRMVPVLKKGLGNRVYRIFPKPQNEIVWSITEQHPKVYTRPLWFGLHLNTEFSDNVLVMGPAADNPEAKDFRDFWGQKSQLRRFQDGSINEAVLWSCRNQSEKNFICQNIIEYLLPLHFGISSESITYHGHEFNEILRTSLSTSSEKGGSGAKYTRGCGEEESMHALKTFDELSKQIRAMENVPLKINSIHPIDPAMRLTEPLTPRQYQVKGDKNNDTLLRPTPESASPVWCPAFKALIQFETSGKWPDDIVAIQHIKAAFHIQLAQCIRGQLRIPSIATPEWIDIMKNGYVFRLSVVHYREMILYKESTETGSLKKEHDAKAKQLDLLIVKKPLHNSLLHSLNTQHRSYSLTTRLAKRWVCSQLLSDYLTDQAVELMVAYIFLSPAPMQSPNSHMAGFLRFLNLMAKFDWKNDPLIVNLNDQLKNEDFDTITEKFTSNRDQLPAMFIATSYDQETSVWTKNNPTTQILRRASMLAQAALDLIEENMSVGVVKQLFRPSLKDFHVVIELNTDHVPQKVLLSDPVVKSKSSRVKICPTLNENVVNTVLPTVDFDPTREYLKELRDAFSEVALFFYDKYGGTNIGVVWKTTSLTPQPFKAMDSKYRKYEDIPKVKNRKGKIKQSKSKEATKRNLIPNIEAIMCDFKVLGRGLVLNVIEYTKVT